MLCYGFSYPGPGCNAKVSPTQAPLGQCGSQTKYCVIPDVTEQDIFSIASLISKQVVLYRTCGGTDCSEGPTPKNRSLADSNKTNHIY
jgi:hypothetical protein